MHSWMRCCDPLPVRSFIPPCLPLGDSHLSVVLELCQCANAWICPPSLPRSFLQGQWLKLLIWLLPWWTIPASPPPPPAGWTPRQWLPPWSRLTPGCALVVLRWAAQVQERLLVRDGTQGWDYWKCVGRGTQTKGQGRPDGTPLSSAVNFRETERVKSPWSGTEGEIISSDSWSHLRTMQK